MRPKEVPFTGSVAPRIWSEVSLAPLPLEEPLPPLVPLLLCRFSGSASCLAGGGCDP